MSEKKCKKCKLTYKGLKEKCPYCHKTTGFGIFNKIMMIMGYIVTAVIIGAIIDYCLTILLVGVIWYVPLIITAAILAGIIVLIIKLIRG